jgi:hypothetical protein
MATQATKRSYGIVLNIGGEEQRVTPVAGGEREGEQFAPGYPREGGMLEADRIAIDFDRQELDDVLRARVGYRELDRTHGCNLHAQFLAQLALNRFEMGFARLDFAAGKLPEATVSFVGRALADQYPIASADDRCDYTNHERAR